MAEVLVVDDSNFDRSIIRRLLEATGYIVHEATGGIDALDVLIKEHNSLDLVLSDDNMPKGDGIFLVGRVKEHWPNIPVVMVSGNDHYRDNEHEVRKLGFSGFVAKKHWQGPEEFLAEIKPYLK